MTDSTMQKQFDNEKVEAETANNKPKRKRIFKLALTGAFMAIMVTGGYYVYGLIFPDPWYVRALAIFGF